MKPLLLEMQAFGPFARQQVIDFRHLGSKTFFLIHGPTGSGKTSILDAMCFALFGDSSGDERKAGDLRSQHAAAALATEVRFEFALGDRRYRVRRIPEQLRPAVRGDRLVRRAHEAELVALTEGDGTEQGQALAAGWEKVTRRVVELLGFESRQFRQVIVLPQGRFFEFLKAGSQEREKILQVLFGTEMYRRIEESLKRAADDLQRQARECDTQRTTLLDQAQVDSIESLQACRSAQALALGEAIIRAEAAAQAEVAAQQVLQRQQQAAAQFDEDDAAQAALATLQQQSPLWQGRREALEAARRAEALSPYEQAWREARQASERAQASAAAAFQSLDSAKANEQRAREELALREATRPDIERLGNRLSELNTLHARVESLESARSAAKQASERHASAQGALSRARAAAEAARDAHLRLQAQVQASDAAAAPLEACRLQVQQLQERQELAAREAALRSALAQADRLVQARTRSLELARDADRAAAAAREQVMRRWLAGQAARIAHRLQDGQPCPVCGSAEHPAPAAAASDAVDDDALQSADDACRSAGEALEAAQQALTEAGLARAEHAGAVGALASGASGADAQELDLSLPAARTALQQAQAAARAAETLRARLPAAAQASVLADQALEAARQEAQSAAVESGTAAATLNEREQAVPTGLDTRIALDAALRQARAERDALQAALESAGTQVQQAGAGLAAAQVAASHAQEADLQAQALLLQKDADFIQRLHDCGFATPQAFAAARRDPADVEQMAHALTAFEQSLASARDRAARSALAVKALDRPDLAAADAACRAAAAAKVDAVQAASLAQSALAATDSFLASLRDIQARHSAIEDRYRVLRDVADKANGQNGQRMSFQRYVLATLLDEVLAATTQRLRVMSRGRYEMRRRLEATDSRSAGGLDLMVFDHYTGHDRGVHTLSGGESFLASLALALGLSDVVQSYAGGIRLDAIFVDEGFGTLDPEALDFAIRTLKDLQQAGRMVGIISHVAELKGWIDARLEVRLSQAGSEASFVV